MLRWFRDRRPPLSEQIAALRTLAGMVPEVHAERYGHRKCEPPKPRTVRAWLKTYVNDRRSA